MVVAPSSLNEEICRSGAASTAIVSWFVETEEKFDPEIVPWTDTVFFPAGTGFATVAPKATRMVEPDDKVPTVTSSPVIVAGPCDPAAGDGLAGVEWTPVYPDKVA